MVVHELLILKLVQKLRVKCLDFLQQFDEVILYDLIKCGGVVFFVFIFSRVIFLIIYVY